MALRAGYYGIKKNVLAAISNLSGAKIIKSIGDGLKLTSAGKLSCDIDSETMEFKNGKLASKSISNIKTYTYEGDGQNQRTLVLDNPQIVIGIYELGFHEGYKGFVGSFDKDETNILCYWWKGGTNPGCSQKNVTVSGNDVTLSGDPTHIANGANCKYIVLYI